MAAVEAEIRRQKLLAESGKFRRFCYHCVRSGQEKGRMVSERETGPWMPGESTFLAVAETVTRALIRRRQEGGELLFAAGDLTALRTRGKTPLQICLLLDTSGSMQGRRLEEVRKLAAYLAEKMHEPVSLVTFRENEVCVKLAATRRAHLVREGLKTLAAGGLTPLGEGIRQAAAYVKKYRGRKHLVILITDGMPTWAAGDRDPALDAIMAAKSLRCAHARLVCIGLEPQRAFLEQLAAAADAALYLLPDLEYRELAAIARREKSGLAGSE